MGKYEDDLKLLKEFKSRYESAKEFEAKFKQNALADLKFFLGDSVNNFQWSDEVLSTRQAGRRPCLTNNKVLQHVLQVENQCWQNNMSVKIRGTGFGSSGITANALESIIRHIEYKSNATQNAYKNAIQEQIRVGIGYVHITTDYEDSESFNQDFCIKSVSYNNVFSDPDCIEPDHSDAKFCVLKTCYSRDEFLDLYPDYDEEDYSVRYEFDDYGFSKSKESYEVFRYYKKSDKQDTVYAIPDDQGVFITIKKSDMTKEQIKQAELAKYRKRTVKNPVVEYYDFYKNSVVAKGNTVFKRIPVVAFIGMESVVHGKLERKGFVRNMIDAQRMYNLASSGFVELLSLQSRAPFIVDAKAIEGYEGEWSKANTENQAYLPFNSVDPENPTINLQMPTRQTPPEASQGYLQAMQNAENQLSIVSGQYAAELGAGGNEKSGIAIAQRQRQSDNAVYNYTDNQGAALRLIGKILLESIPLIYDTKRALTCIGISGDERNIIIDPDLQKSHVILDKNGNPVQDEGNDSDMSPQDQERIKLEEKGAILAINPSVGKYEVEADVGPSYATQKQETYNAVSQILQSSPQLFSVFGDLLFKSADFPLSDEIARRIVESKNEAKDAQNSAQNQQFAEQTQKLQAQIAELQAKLNDKTFDNNYKLEKLRHDNAIDLMIHDQKVRENDVKEITGIGSINPQLLEPVLRDAVKRMVAEDKPENSSINNEVSQSMDTNELPEFGFHGSMSEPEEQEGQDVKVDSLPSLPSTNPPSGLITSGE